MQGCVPPLPAEWGPSVTSQKIHGGRQGNSYIVSVRTRQYLSSRAFLTDKALEIRILRGFVRPG